MAIELIEEAVSAGARRHKACGVLEITVRTLQRWQKSLAEYQQLGDQRKLAAAERLPANKLTEIERLCILAISNSQAYRSLPPSQIVPRLADEGEYMASESTFYRVLREADQVNRPGRAKPPRTLNKPQGYKATGPNQLWSWDITFVNGQL
jgi:transposase InsO family protein